jgi:hypothetical protein
VHEVTVALNRHAVFSSTPKLAASYGSQRIWFPGTRSLDAIAKQHRVRIYTLEHTPPPYAGLTVAPDERSLLYSDRTEVESHVTLVNDFR